MRDFKYEGIEGENEYSSFWKGNMLHDGASAKLSVVEIQEVMI